MKAGVYCFPDAPHQRGTLWFRIENDTVTIMEPAGAYWRGKVFTIEEFNKEINSGQG